jgi:hypothetical protein
MPLERNRYAAGQYMWIAFRDDAGGVSLDWTNAGVSLAGNRNTMHPRCAGSGDDLAAVTGNVTESDYTFHFFPPAVDFSCARSAFRQNDVLQFSGLQSNAIQ